jgi:hypothetical protein
MRCDAKCNEDERDLKHGVLSAAEAYVKFEINVEAARPKAAVCNNLSDKRSELTGRRIDVHFQEPTRGLASN